MYLDISQIIDDGNVPAWAAELYDMQQRQVEDDAIEYLSQQPADYDPVAEYFKEQEEIERGKPELSLKELIRRINEN